MLRVTDLMSVSSKISQQHKDSFQKEDILIYEFCKTV